MIRITLGIKVRDREQRFPLVPRDRAEDFGHDDNFIAREVVFLDGTTEDLLREAVGIGLTTHYISFEVDVSLRTYVGGVEGVDSCVIS